MGNCLTKYVQLCFGYFLKKADNEAADVVTDCLRNAANVDDEAADAMTDCLGNSVVLRKILEHFSSKELRQLSFVNKQWKWEAQSLMRNRGELTAYVKSEGFDRNNPQKGIDDFISDLKQMNPVPYSGISIDVWMEAFPDPIPIPALDYVDLEDVLFDQPTLKTVSLKFDGSWMASPGVVLAKKLLQDCSGLLEELELAIFDGQENFMEMVVQDCTFPRLQVLKLSGIGFRLDAAGYENYMKVFLARAPNLKALHSAGSLNVLLSVLEGSSVIPVYGHALAPFDEISENVLSKIKVERMSLEYDGDEFNFERFNRITPMLLQQCCTTTLRCMCLDAVLAVPLMTYGIRLENVKNLYMDIAFGDLEFPDPRISRILKNFDFSRIFPNLNKVKIDSYYQCGQPLLPDGMNAIIERANAILREPMPDRAARVKELVLRWNPAQFYVEMLPNIKKLEIIAHDGEISFSSIWSWLDLKELKVRGDLLPTTGNLDSFFCGIFPEEVTELRLKDDEYLKRVNIVPVMPAVTCVKNLRTLSLHHEHHHRDPFGDDETCIFSTVTVLLAFARLPALGVSLKICAEEATPAMPHLEPYVSVTSELSDDEYCSVHRRYQCTGRME